ncbi:hypothetical protein AC482_05665 [miscellaneous Crenarchaeota group-15 archaeon DG-45]|uniref:Hydrolase n=1 Tax=miscellaneous Crenarchaeota group-15 archaeon DG-45 TaxID=1685127 RepID=A0A0M0BN51_9ARCH|nr:MAG: hypothetical protein AC482_05665 [miscellaneous Crenarchaeota group-15 archaeon DG-45]
MPFTPFHLGPALLFGLVFFRYLDFPTFLVANVIVDIEPLVVLALGLDLPLHGFLHTFLGGTLVALLLASFMMRAGRSLGPLLGFFHLGQTQRRKGVYAAALSGVYLHILLDARLHADIRPFYPSTANPLLSGSVFPGIEVYAFCVFSALTGAALYLLRVLIARDSALKRRGNGKS